MKLKKITAFIAAAVTAVYAASIVCAADEYTAVMGFADTMFSVQDWEASAAVTGDGQYTIESTAVAGAQDIGVFVIDIKGMSAAAPEAAAVLDKIEIDGSEIEFDADKINYGDIEGNGNYRIEIFNQYNDSTKNDPAVDQASAVSSSVKVTFTVSGLGGEAPTSAESEPAAAETAETEETTETAEKQEADDTAAPEPDSSTGSAVTGNSSSSAMLYVIAFAGVVAFLSKKK